MRHSLSLLWNYHLTLKSFILRTSLPSRLRSISQPTLPNRQRPRYLWLCRFSQRRNIPDLISAEMWLGSTSYWWLWGDWWVTEYLQIIRDHDFDGIEVVHVHDFGKLLLFATCCASLMWIILASPQLAGVSSRHFFCASISSAVSCSSTFILCNVFAQSKVLSRFHGNQLLDLSIEFKIDHDR